MSDSSAGVVVVGAGLTAAHLVATLRDEGYDAPIAVVGDEGERPYERPPLSKSYLQGTSPAEKAYVHDEEWYSARDVDARWADPAVSIDRASRRVRLRSGDEIAYDTLVIATGARPRRLSIPGAEHPRVLTLRTLADSTAVRGALASDQRWVIIGAGWIGLEVAAAARGADRTVTVLEHADLPLQNVLGHGLARHVAQMHRAHGVDLRLSTTISAIEESGGSLAVRTDSGPVPADVVVMAVGVQPNVELARDAGLLIDNGIVVDEHLRTADPAILAAGDVASAAHVTLRTRLRVEHWDNAIRQGTLAAQTILGRETAYDWHPYFFTDQYGLGMEYVGHGGRDDEVVLRGHLDESGSDDADFIAFWLRHADGAGGGESVVTAAMNVNIWDVNDQLRALIGRAIAPQRLRDPAIPLDAL